MTFIAGPMSMAAQTGPQLVYRIPVQPPPVQAFAAPNHGLKLAYINFWPRKGESFDDLVARMNTLVGEAHLNVMSVETVVIGDAAKNLHRTFFVHPSERVLCSSQFVRIWYNGNDPVHQTDSVQKLIKRCETRFKQVEEEEEQSCAVQ
eukprot:TRINITY_DN3041_c0_g1_i1.p1 TRINITY_DN3041_c0_g1~~TRINITY_DN3041_c0_g1_i1.p1  ORF type:complete len:148 (-),score=17.72 TRINITY_DN3041_c0_g1_i1:663-1106(-)